MQSKGKFIVAFLYALAVVAVPILDGPHQPTPAEWIAIAIAACTAALTWLVPLVPSATWVKSAVGAVLAGLQVAVTVIDGGINGNDGLLIVFAVLAALGITVAPAASPKTRTAVGWGSDYALAA
jgi:hypothetical protein